MSWPFQGRKTNDHALIKGCGKLDASASPQLPAPFLRFFTPAHRDSRAVLPAAGHGGQRTPNISQIDTLSALRFAGVPGTTTSRDRVVGASSTSLASGFAKSSLIPLLLLSHKVIRLCGGPIIAPPPAPWHRASPAAQGSASRSQPEESQDTRGLRRSRVQRPCPQRRRGKFHIPRFRLCRKLVHFTAPPLQIEPAALGFDLGLEHDRVNPTYKG